MTKRCNKNYPLVTTLQLKLLDGHLHKLNILDVTQSVQRSSLHLYRPLDSSILIIPLQTHLKCLLPLSPPPSPQVIRNHKNGQEPRHRSAYGFTYDGCFRLTMPGCGRRENGKVCWRYIGEGKGGCREI